MKKTFLSYFLPPIIMLGVFIFVYQGALKQMALKDEAKAVAKAKFEAEEAARKAEIEKKASEDAARRQREREAEEAAKAKKKEDEYLAVMAQLRSEAADYNAQADKLNKEVQDLELAISQARTTKEKLNRETFDLSKEVELAKIARRNAEIEIQRMIEITGKKVADTSIAKPPVLPTN
jgi:ABC-type Na+ efflux pump permease subunit